MVATLALACVLALGQTTGNAASSDDLATKVRALGWAPRHGLDEALAETVAWYRDNRPWWEKLR